MDIGLFDSFVNRCAHGIRQLLQRVFHSLNLLCKCHDFIPKFNLVFFLSLHSYSLFHHMLQSYEVYPAGFLRQEIVIPLQYEPILHMFLTYFDDVALENVQLRQDLVVEVFEVLVQTVSLLQL